MSEEKYMMVWAAWIMGLLVSSGFGAVMFAYAYRLIVETRMRLKAFERTIEPSATPEPADELAQRLEKFRNERFAPPLVAREPGGQIRMVRRQITTQAQK